MPKKQMTLVSFMAEYDMSRPTVQRLIYRQSNPFPAFKIGGQWYVNIEAFEKWRVEEHKRQYRYA